jgi:teichoic acid glycerol-phosphate primase
MFHFCKAQRKITLLVSFEDNNRFLYRKIVEQDPTVKVVLLYKTKLSKELQRELTKNTVAIKFEANLLNWIVSIYHISTSRILVADNYYGFLAAIKLKEDVECIQIWHAAGAFKTFGLTDKSTAKRVKWAHKRFKKVYSQFHKVVVGSDEMASIFMEAFDVPSLHVLRTGIPRTDFFFNQMGMEQAKQRLLKKYPALAGKKMILYAPTYRDGLLNDDKIHLDLDKMYKALHQDYVLIIKAHPAVKVKRRKEEKYSDFIFNLTGKSRVEDLLVLVDYLITDYSSLPFEYSILEKPMIFYPYDYEIYEKERGLISDYKQMVPGPIAYQTDDIIDLLLKDEFNLDKVREFSKTWNRYSDGHSSERLARYLIETLNH